MEIRPTEHGDLEALKTIIDATALFPSALLADMIAPFLNSADGAIWLTALTDDVPVGMVYAQAETLADGVWNMLALAVSPNMQKQGVGRAMVRDLEGRLKSLEARIVIADTSGMDSFVDTRVFYEKSGYVEEARIRDFWAVGDDKVTFRKSLKN